MKKKNEQYIDAKKAVELAKRLEKICCWYSYGEAFLAINLLDKWQTIDFLQDCEGAAS